MKKKVFPLIISLVMVLALGPMSVFADNDEELNSGEIVNKYEIKLLDKSLTYGDAFGGGVIDVNNVKLNGNIVDPKKAPLYYKLVRQLILFVQMLTMAKFMKQKTALSYR